MCWQDQKRNCHTLLARTLILVLSWAHGVSPIGIVPGEPASPSEGPASWSEGHASPSGTDHDDPGSLSKGHASPIWTDHDDPANPIEEHVSPTGAQTDSANPSRCEDPDMDLQSLHVPLAQADSMMTDSMTADNLYLACNIASDKVKDDHNHWT